MDGGGFPYPKLPQYPRHVDAENVPTFPSSLLLVPDSPKPGSFIVLPHLGRLSGTSAVPHLGSRLPNYVYPMPLAHLVSSCAPPSIQVPYPPRTPYNVPVPSVTPVKTGPLPSSVPHTPPMNGSPPPGICSRP